MDNKELKDVSSKSAIGVAKNTVAEAATRMSPLIKQGAGIVGSVAKKVAEPAAYIFVPGVILGEILGRGFAELNLPMEERVRMRQVHGGVLPEAGKALAQDAKWAVGEAVGFVIDKSAPGLSAIGLPALEASSKKWRKSLDERLGIDPHQASAITALNDTTSEAVGVATKPAVAFWKKEIKDGKDAVVHAHGAAVATGVKGIEYGADTAHKAVSAVSSAHRQAVEKTSAAIGAVAKTAEHAQALLVGFSKEKLGDFRVSKEAKNSPAPKASTLKS